MNRKLIAGIVLLIPFSYIYGLSLLSLFIKSAGIITPSILVLSLLMNLLVMGGSSILCIYVLYGGSFRDILHKLYFRKEGTLRSSVMGIATAIIFIFSVAIFVYFLQGLGYGTENEMAQEIAENVNLPLLFVIPFLSALSEEIFFRAFLQMRMAKFLGQPAAIFISSSLFAIAHISYKNPLQIAIPFILGIALGYLMMKNENVMAPFSAHFAFNFIQLAPFVFT